MTVCCTSQFYILYIGGKVRLDIFKNGSRNIVRNSLRHIPSAFCFWVVLNSFRKINLPAMFDVMRAVLMSRQFSWDKIHVQMLCSCRSFGGVCLVCHLAKMFWGFFEPKYGNLLLLRNVENFLRCDTTSYYRRNEFLSSPVRKSCLPVYILYISTSIFLPLLVVVICVCR
jgi:hypothetical protein